MSRELAVLLYRRVIATVEQNRQGRHRLTYADSYSGPDATPLSLSMPVTPAPYAGRRIDAYMAGLLPDSMDVRERWAAEWGVSAANPFALLEKMGLDCAGAVQFVHPDNVGEAIERPSRLESVTVADIAARLARLRSDDASWVVPGERWSLAGAQGKFTLARRRDGTWFEPMGAAASTHIVKPGISGYRAQALNEHLCMQAAAACGLDAARTEYTLFDDQPALVVARYDRRRRGDDVVRVHQEDMRQALAVFPRDKYEANRGPGVQKIAELLWARATEPEADVRRFVAAVAFNYLVGAPDVHAKNFSVLMAGQQVRLAPLYDIASALAYEPTRSDSELDLSAMSIGGRRRFGDVTGHHWDTMSRLCRVPAREVHDVVRGLADTLPRAIEDAAAGVRNGDEQLSDRLVAGVRRSCARALRQLEE